MVHLWLRGETKKNEQRSALTPSVVKTLLAEGFQITVERSAVRIFDDQDFVTAGAKLVETGTWRQAPSDAYVVGLKELPERDDSPLPHAHIMFAHCFKRQEGWSDVLSRFDRGHGTLLDLEFLVDDRGRRVAAFGYYAGYAGAAMGVDVWCHRILEGNKPYVAPKPFNTEDDLNTYVRAKLAAAAAKAGRLPRIMVMGALGRCGSGACDLATKVVIPNENIIRWDMKETASGGPFPEILTHDIFVNCIYLTSRIPPFMTKETLRDAGPQRPLRVLVDVSCDTTNPNNPLPVYTRCTTFDDPLETVDCGSAPPLDVVSIDHLPTLLPREASEFFCRDLLPTLRELKDRSKSDVWGRAEKLFREKVEEAKVPPASVVKA
ncbi:Saccharopine dehydrogenase [Irineochytrium annulatum]|nr:Saccharopine dehydrogenase [Irineochytrium annulatum]